MISNTERFDEFFRAVKSMRKAQRDYFALRSGRVASPGEISEALSASKRSESLVDRLVVEIMSGDGHPRLF